MSLSTSVQAQSDPAKLIAFWNFDDASSTNALDLKHGIVGSLTDGAIYTATGGGRSGVGADRSVDFGTTGARQRVRIRDVAWLNQMFKSNDVVTVSYWQKLRQVANSSAFWAVTPSRERAISAHAPWGDSTVYWDTGGSGGAEGTPGFGTRINVASSTFPTGFGWTNWNHIVFLKNGATKQIWVNGTLVIEDPNAVVSLVTDITDFAIGGHPAATGSTRGWIDDFAIFAGALDETQITALAGGAAPSTLDVDTDTDGMPDWWEDLHALDKTVNDAALDKDGDGASNLTEYLRFSDATATDTDGDGLSDGAESNTGVWVSATNTGTNPIATDSDDDGLTDGVENNSGNFVSLGNPGTNPVQRDSDGDGFLDYVEASLGGNPVNNTISPLKAGSVNLLAWWDFNDATSAETSLDKVHGFPGTLVGGAVFTEEGFGRSETGTDRALDLGLATTELMSVDNARWLGAVSPSNSVTVAFWLKWHTVGPVANNTFWADDRKDLANPIVNGHVPWTDRNIYWDTTVSAAPAGRINKVLPVDFDLSGWHHYAFVKSGNAKQIFVDGALFHSGSNTGPLPPDVQRLMVGGHLGTPTPRSSVNGLMDDFAIFVKGLSASEIALLAGGATPGSLVLDADGDGMPDLWEEANSFDKNSGADAGLDADSDGLTNLQEYLRATSPRDDDSDDDGLKDGAETNTSVWVSATNTGTNPLIADTDGDGLSDGVESNTGVYVSATDTGSSPLNIDSDGDLYPDITEVLLGVSPASSTIIPLTAGSVNLLAYWNFNDVLTPDEAKDVIHGFTGAFGLDVGYTEDTGGRSGAAGDSAVLFPGFNGSVMRIPNAQFMSAVGPSNEMTISFWQKQTFPAPGASASYWVDSATPALARFSAVHAPWSDGTIYFDAGGGATAGQHRINRSMTTANPEFDWTAWNHFALVRKGTNQQIWINGTNFHQGSVTVPLQRDATTMGIGGQFSGGNAFNGAIDDFAVYGTALDANQIGALASGASPQALPAGSFNITSTSFAGGVFALTFQSAPGQTYKVYRTSEVTTWGASLADVPASATGSTTTYTDNNPPGGAGAVFYKIQRQ